MTIVERTRSVVNEGEVEDISTLLEKILCKIDALDSRLLELVNKREKGKREWKHSEVKKDESKVPVVKEEESKDFEVEEEGQKDQMVKDSNIFEYSVSKQCQHDHVEIITYDEGKRTITNDMTFTDPVRVMGETAKDMVTQDPNKRVFTLRRLPFSLNMNAELTMIVPCRFNLLNFTSDLQRTVSIPLLSRLVKGFLEHSCPVEQGMLYFHSYVGKYGLIEYCLQSLFKSAFAPSSGDVEKDPSTESYSNCLRIGTIAYATANVGPASVKLLVLQGFNGTTTKMRVGLRTIIEKGGTVLTCVVDFQGIIMNYVSPHPDFVIMEIYLRAHLLARKWGSTNKFHSKEWSGYFLSLQNTTTASILCCMDRKSIDLHLGEFGKKYLQTCSTINVGHSDEPLVNGNEEVIGVNIIKVLGADGLSFPIGIDLVSKISDQFNMGGGITPWLGVRMDDLNGMIIAQLLGRGPGFSHVKKDVLVPIVTPESFLFCAGVESFYVVTLENFVKSIIEILDPWKSRIKILIKSLLREEGLRKIILTIPFEEMQAMFFIETRDIIEAQLGSNCKSIIMMVFAYFNASKRQAIKDVDVLAKFCEEFERNNKDIRGNAKRLERLKTSCKGVERTFLCTVWTTIKIDSLHKEINFYTIISRARFKQLNMDLFSKCMASMEKFVLDLGGFLRNSRVLQLLQNFYYGKMVRESITLVEIIACDNVIVQNILSDVMIVLVPKNIVIPINKEQVLSMYSDNHLDMLIQVHEGEIARSRDNRLLGKFEKRAQFVLQLENWIYVMLQPYKQIWAKDKNYQKQSRGPYRVITKEGEVDVTFLPAVGRQRKITKCILTKKMIKTDEVWAEWNEGDITTALWEAVLDLQTKLPNYTLEDKGVIEREVLMREIKKASKTRDRVKGVTIRPRETEVKKFIMTRNQR